MPTYEVEVSFRDKEVIVVNAVNEEDASEKALADLKSEYYPGALASDFKVEGIIEVLD